MASDPSDYANTSRGAAKRGIHSGMRAFSFHGTSRVSKSEYAPSKDSSPYLTPKWWEAPLRVEPRLALFLSVGQFVQHFFPALRYQGSLRLFRAAKTQLFLRGFFFSNLNNLRSVRHC